MKKAVDKKAAKAHEEAVAQSLAERLGRFNIRLVKNFVDSSSSSDDDTD